MKTLYQENSYIKWPWGKHQGKYLRDLPDDYLRWAVIAITDTGMAQICADELARRDPALGKKSHK
jgi:hypothetical protein